MVVKFETYYGEVYRCMTQKRAERIRHLRVECGNDYQTVSAAVHKDWGADATWAKAGEANAGEALSVAAARHLGEIPWQAPWA